MNTSHRHILIFAAVGILLIAGMVSVPLVRAGAVHRDAAATSTSRSITTQGHGSKVVTPTQASITVGVQNRSATVAAAMASNARSIASVVTAIKGQGVVETSIQTTNLSLWFDTTDQTYVVSHDVTVRLDALEKLAPMLDAAVNAGANSSWGISYGVKDDTAARATALRSALADARKRAEVIAKSLGLSVTGVKAVTENTTGTGPIPAGKGGMGGGAAPIQPGEMAVTSDVTVSYLAQ